MVFEALVWKTSPGACEVDPPVSGRGPWSTTVTRSQPRAVSSSARLAPTIPAPMMTTRGVVGIALLLTAGRAGGVPRRRREDGDPDQGSGDGRDCGAELPAPAREQAGLVHPEDGDGRAVALVHHQEAAVGAAALHDPRDVALPAGAGELDPGAVLVG